MARIKRRTLLVGAMAALAAPALQGCFPRGRPSPSAMPPSGRLVVAQGADPATLHPLLQTGLVEASAYGNIFDSLVALDAEGRLQPSLAESWQVRDEHAWVFSLRTGVSFHNGEPFDAESVRFTVERVLDAATGSPIRPQLSAIDRVEVPDSHTAVIVTHGPFSPLLAELTGLMMVPPRYTSQVGYAGLASQPVGTGPFRFVERVKDDRIVLEAHGEHWRGAPAVGRLELRPLPDATSRLAAVRTGQVDLATNVPHEHVEGLERDGIRVATRPGIQALYVRLNMRKPPLDDIRVRQAIAHAVDIDQIIATVYGGRARRINGPYPPEVFGYDNHFAWHPHDPERARWLLRAAGVSEGTTLVFETPRGRYPKDDQVVQVLAGYLADVGLQTRIQVVDWAAYLDKLQAGQGEHLFLLAGTNRTLDPHFTIVRLYTNGGAFGRAYYGNPEVDSLASEAAATLEPRGRELLYHRILALLRADVPALWIAQLDDLYAVRPGLIWRPRPDSLLWLHGASWAA
jgi:peptide/nickel transport system substrate-binding protein